MVLVLRFLMALAHVAGGASSSEEDFIRHRVPRVPSALAVASLDSSSEEDFLTNRSTRALLSIQAAIVPHAPPAAHAPPAPPSHVLFGQLGAKRRKYVPQVREGRTPKGKGKGSVAADENASITVEHQIAEMLFAGRRNGKPTRLRTQKSMASDLGISLQSLTPKLYSIAYAGMATTKAVIVSFIKWLMASCGVVRDAETGRVTQSTTPYLFIRRRKYDGTRIHLKVQVETKDDNSTLLEQVDSPQEIMAMESGSVLTLGPQPVSLIVAAIDWGILGV